MPDGRSGSPISLRSSWSSTSSLRRPRATASSRSCWSGYCSAFRGGSSWILQARIDSAWLDHSVIAMAICKGSSVQAAFLMDEHIKKDEILYKQKYGRPEPEDKDI